MIYLLINVLGCVTTTTLLNIMDRRNHSVLNKTKKRKSEVGKEEMKGIALRPQLFLSSFTCPNPITAYL